MLHPVIYLIVLLLSVLSGASLTVLMIMVANRLGVFDYPDRERKCHPVAVPLLGGAAICGSFLVVTAALWRTGFLPDEKITQNVILGLLFGSVALMVGGYLDDRFHLPPGLQILAPFVAAFCVVVSGVAITVVTNPIGGVLKIPLWFSPVLTFVWMLGMMYTTKFLDGLDGLVASLTAIGGFIIFGVSLSWDAPSASTPLLALALAGSCLGFLPFNFSPAKIFLGEGGSVFTGYLLGLLAIVSGSKITTALLVMGVPMLDAAWVIIGRLYRRSSPTRGDRSHLHFQLVRRGFTDQQVLENAGKI